MSTWWALLLGNFSWPVHMAIQVYLKFSVLKLVRKCFQLIYQIWKIAAITLSPVENVIDNYEHVSS
jgi:hypothetical protein